MALRPILKSSDVGVEELSELEFIHCADISASCVLTAFTGIVLGFLVILKKRLCVMPLELDVETETMRLLNSPWNAKKSYI